MASQGLKWLRNAVVAVFVLSLLAAILLPVYTDEVGWRMQMRAGFDGIDKLYNETCGPNTLARPPFFVMPARWYSALFNGLFPDPLYVRLSGILYALAWVAMVLALIRRIAATAGDRALLGATGFGLMALGTMPLLLVWSRPEQPIVLAFTAALLLALSDRDDDGASSARTAWLRSLAILALGIVAVSYHIKAIFLLPLLLACIVCASRGRASHVPRAIAAVLLIAATAIAAQYWIHRLECPADAAMQANFARNNAGALLVKTSGLTHQIRIVIDLIGNMQLTQYLGLPAPRFEPMSFWLAGGRISDVSGFQWFVALVLLWWGALLLTFGAFATAVPHLLRARRLDRRLVLAALLVAAALGWSATQGYRNVYEALFVLPLLMLAVVLALSTLAETSRVRRFANVLAVLLSLAGVASPIAIGAIYGPSLVDAAGQRGYIAGQPHSISVFGYGSMEADIRATARLCGIRTDDASKLVIDDVTYFTYMQNHLPQHAIGLFDRTIPRANAFAYLRRRGSPGGVVACQSMRPENRARARRHGQFCCLASPNW